MITDDPSQHRWISEEELRYIRHNRILSEVETRQKLPLCQILTNVPVIAIALCSFSNDWGLYLLLTEGPNFMSSVLGKDIATVNL